MAEEKIRVKWRVAGIDFSDNTDIVDKATALAAEWKTAPDTLRDDELLITPPTINKTPIYSHEADSPVENEITIGDPRNIAGSFIRMTIAQLVELIGGNSDGTAYLMEDVLKILQKAIRIRFQGGGWVVYPRVEGYVLLDMNVGYNSRVKAPFDFTPLVPATGGNIVGIWETDVTAVIPAPQTIVAKAMPLSAPVTTTETTTTSTTKK
ncbi:hypothetical protein M2451_003319 [Dysgonomonas sp. PFB1-18]|uniref:hypothetical protein n=1 Tax=unclassified Dysgonomonas TaxID=2630389 RepID=UPI0024768C38|nr:MULTISPECIES: hypothetical protein [unclassified Dysgonomonas]MDH6310591.1 hypothetical protein [Dysgonomonas sp. PF1-14]MDH6340441.1 hypothetical protein [Dysgonomonas sp. PF1-16]MDH6381979.1 hypothetical protein [Dysgonomonas sp. PFB1-18]MDH6399412.1 hypothetical protein [Dysgonomonas sp. PF1-23]